MAKKFKVGTKVISKGTFCGAHGKIVADYSNCGKPKYRQVMFGSGRRRFSATMHIDELKEST
jgi:hypothetical protein